MSRELGSTGPFDDDKRGAPAGRLYCQSQGNIEARGNVTVKDLLLDHVIGELFTINTDCLMKQNEKTP